MIWSRSDLATWSTKHFKAKEFECHDNVCQRQVCDDKLLSMLEEVRELVGMPLTITSGFRCAKRQDDLRKQGLETATGISSHEMGQAADIACADMTKLREACEQVFAKYSIGVAKVFIHVDVRAGGPRRWSYTRS
jgi:uncharacterized protein YcbK (DUF882 family)